MNHNQKLSHLGEVYPEQKRQLFKYFRHQAEALEVFVSAVDVSDYPFAEWLNALDVMTDWLAKKGQTMTLNNKIQYLNCASEIIDQEAQWDNMASAILPILELHGCERSSDETNKNL